MKKILALTFCLTAALSAQEFGFGFDAPADAPAGAGAPAVTIGGTVSAGFTFFPGDFDAPGDIKAGDVFSGSLTVSARGSHADAVISLDVKPNFDRPTEILSLDEAYLRAVYGRFSIEGGLRKLTWGRADSLGPLDVINPLDYSDFTALSDPASIKIARPLLRGEFRLGNFTKLEAVFVPWFEGSRFDAAGRWAPAVMTEMPGRMNAAVVEHITNTAPPSIPPASLPTILAGIAGSLPAMPQAPSYGLHLDTLAYAQGGLRFTTTLGPADFGLQYYYGRLSRPAVSISGIKDFWADFDYVSSQPGKPIAVDVAYNPYHQIGLDYAQVLFGFNLRAELAANITEDISGEDGGVYNPALLWSLGFDRDIVAGINCNVQVNESVILLHDRISPNRAIDAEAGARLTSTRLTAVVSKKIFRDELELRAAVIWGIEDRDCYIIPAIIWTRGDVSLELSGGIFAGEEEGELGQYRDGGFVKTLLSWSF